MIQGEEKRGEKEKIQNHHTVQPSTMNFSEYLLQQAHISVLWFHKKIDLGACPGKVSQHVK